MTEFPRPVLSSLLEALGESDTLIGGHLETVLTTALAWDDTEVVVAATERWPDPADLDIDGETISVTTKDATTFTIVTRGDALPTTPLVSPGARVVDISRVYSDRDVSRRQMLSKYATGAYLTRIATNYGLPRPGYRGQPLFLTEEQFRVYLQVVAFLRAGPLWGIMRVLDPVFPPVVTTGSTSSSLPQRVTFSTAVLPSNMTRSLVRLDEDWGRVHRITEMDPDGLYLELSPVNGPTWVAAALDTAASVTVELLPWDVWERDDEPGRFFIDLYRLGQTGVPYGTSYFQGGEAQVSTTADQVYTNYPINQVLGVWLASDIDRSGTNYWEDGVGGFGTFSGQLITLGQNLSAPGTDVVVDYGNIDPSTAQLLEDITYENAPNGTYWPLYLSSYSALLTETGILDIIRALGMLPVVSESTWGPVVTPAITEEATVLFSGISVTNHPTDVDALRLTPVGPEGKAFVWVHDGASDWVLVEVPSALDCALDTAGSGGLQTGDTYSASSGYQVVLIAKGTLAAGLRDPVLIAMDNGIDADPVLPTGYTHWSKVLSFAATDATPDLETFRQYNENYVFTNANGGLLVENAYKGNTDSNTDCSAAAPYYGTAMDLYVVGQNNDVATSKDGTVKDKDGSIRWQETLGDGDGKQTSEERVDVPHEYGVQPEVDAVWSAAVTGGGITILVQGFKLLR